VTGVASTTKLDLVRSLGADEVIDYTKADFAADTDRYDVVIDVGGSSSLSRLRRALTHAGTLVIVGGEGGGTLTGMRRQVRAIALSPFVPQRLRMLPPRERAEDLETMAGLVSTCEVTPSVGRTFVLDEAADAMGQLVAGNVRGKIALTIGPSAHGTGTASDQSVRTVASHVGGTLGLHGVG
jgi:NADPH:quinone reductase-like Zn-dependent oxidoreductase